MTPRQIALALALKNASFGLRPGVRSFVGAMVHIAEKMPAMPLTPRQARYLTVLAWTFRRQIPADLAYPSDDAEIEVAERMLYLAAEPIRAGAPVVINKAGRVKNALPPDQRDLFGDG